MGIRFAAMPGFRVGQPFTTWLLLVLESIETREPGQRRWAMREFHTLLLRTGRTTRGLSAVRIRAPTAPRRDPHRLRFRRRIEAISCSSSRGAHQSRCSASLLQGLDRREWQPRFGPLPVLAKFIT